MRESGNQISAIINRVIYVDATRDPVEPVQVAHQGCYLQTKRQTDLADHQCEQSTYEERWIAITAYCGPNTLATMLPGLLRQHRCCCKMYRAIVYSLFLARIL